ncbi:unnamed protein product, partial [Tilletia caries]
PELGIKTYLSRGELVRRWLVGHDDADDGGEGGGPAHISGKQGLEGYLQSVHSKRDFFPGFNLLVGQVESGESDPELKSFRLGYVSNRTEGDQQEPVVLQADRDGMDGGLCAVCGLSNSVYQEPWPKVEEGKGLLKKALEEWDASLATPRSRSVQDGQDVTEADEDRLVEKLFTLLGTNSGPDVPEPQPSNIRATIQVPPLQLPIPGSKSRANAGTSVMIPTSDKNNNVTEAEEDRLVEKLFTLLGTNSDPDVPLPQPSNIRATIQVPPLQLPIPSSKSRANAGTSVLIPTSDKNNSQQSPSSSSQQSGPDSAAAAIQAAIAAGAELGWYGSRLSTVVLVRRRGGAATFVERDVFQLGGDGTVGRAEEKGRKGERRFRWALG